MAPITSSRLSPDPAARGTDRAEGFRDRRERLRWPARVLASWLLAAKARRSTSVPAFNTPQTYDFRQSLSWSPNAHAIKFGFEYEYLAVGISDNGATLGSFTFSGRFSGSNGTWQGGASDLLLGLPTTYSQDSNTIFNRYQDVYSGYAQDDWKITKSLTLNYGLRWDFATPPRETHNQWQQLDLATHTLVAQRTAAFTRGSGLSEL